MTNPINQTPYLRTTWKFPNDLEELVVEINRSFLEVAAFMNVRTIGLYPANRPAIGGETWYITSRKQQNIRQIYTFTGPAPIANIPHGIDPKFGNLPSVSFMTKCSGSFTDINTGNWYGCIFGSNQVIPGQVSFFITGTDIVILVGAGAPPINNGLIVLEWISTGD